MNPKKIPPEAAVFNYLGLAHRDYLAGRHLLRNGFLENGAMLASTAVEKYLKAVIGVHGMSREDHLCSSLYKLVQKCQPSLYDDLDMDFVKFLEKAYRLRYASVSSPGLAIVINQYRTLMALDIAIARIERGFISRDLKTPLATHYKNGIETQDPRLIEENVAINLGDFALIAKKENKIMELKIENNLTTFEVRYETQGVNMQGSFLKIPELSIHKSNFTLTRG